MMGINRYIMECKLFSFPNSSKRAEELIDTLWNVNRFTRLNAIPARQELIDTLWNVNRLIHLGRGVKFEN